MPSFQISITPSRRVAARFVTGVRRTLLRVLEDEHKQSGLKQADIARSIGVHRSVINRELRGMKDLTLGRVAELAWAMGRVAVLDFPEQKISFGSNLPPMTQAQAPTANVSSPIPTTTAGLSIEHILSMTRGSAAPTVKP